MFLTGYDQKKISLTADKDVTFRIEADVDHRGWHPYLEIPVKAGTTREHAFPEGFNAHWVRVVPNRDCVATGWLIYE